MDTMRGRKPFSLAIMLCLIPLQLTIPASPSPATVEDEARAILEKFAAATKAKDANAVSHLLSQDCIIIMPEPVGVSARARFFTRDSYLELMKQRFSETTASNSKREIRQISTSKNGDVFVTTDNEARTLVGTRSEWLRTHEYIVMRRGSSGLLIIMVVAEASFYAPDVPPEPTVEPKASPSE